GMRIQHTSYFLRSAIPLHVSVLRLEFSQTPLGTDYIRADQFANVGKCAPPGFRSAFATATRAPVASNANRAARSRNVGLCASSTPFRPLRPSVRRVAR